jgi:signal transduction histidine kinase
VAGDSRGTETAQPDLGEALREAAAEMAGRLGGHVLLFAGAPAADGVPPLRAAAGFGSAEQARSLAAAIGALVAGAVESGAPRDGIAPDQRSLWVQPLLFAGRVLGAVGVALAEAPSGPARETLLRLAETVSLRLDHAEIRERLLAAEARLENTEQHAEDKNEELLKLSEALFNQDIELLRKNERLGKVEKLKNDFIEKMSRELRTPLNSIIESIISVLAGENENLSEGAKQSLRYALDDGSSFLRTLQNILDLWRIKQGELPVEVQEVNFREVVEEAIFSVQDTLGDKAVRIEKELSEPLPKIRTDLAKVNQILFLLLENAVKFTLEGSITIAVQVAGGELSCSLQDTGIGICPDDRQFIFDDFYQVDEFAGSGYRGAGLGLALVRDLVGLLDGEIEVSSEVGQGSTFSFRVPVQTVA